LGAGIPGPARQAGHILHKIGTGFREVHMKRLLFLAGGLLVMVIAGITLVLAQDTGQAKDPPAKAVPGLVKDLKDGDAGKRRAAALALAALGVDAHAAVAPLGEALKDDKAEVREAAALALGSMGPEARPAIPALATALKDSQTSVRQAAAVSLGNIGSVRSVLPSLLAAFKDKKHAGARQAIAFAIGSMGTEAKEAVPTLLEAL